MVYTCGRCGSLVERDASRCHECGRPYPALFGLRPLLDRIFPLDRSFARLLAPTLVIIYLLTALAAQRTGHTLGPGLNRFSPDGVISLWFGAFHRDFLLNHGQWWRLLTACFLHGGVFHILFNTMALLLLGAHLEAFYGPARFTVLFLVTGAFGYLAGVPFESVTTLGASGGIFGLIGAMICYGYRRGGTYGQMARQQGFQWLIYGLLFGFLVAGVDNYAHAGGAIAGFVLARFFDPYAVDRGRESDAARIAALLCLLVLLLAVGLDVRFAVTHWR